jgi:hypothetical protein
MLMRTEAKLKTEQHCALRCDAVQSGRRLQTFQINILPPASGFKCNPIQRTSKKQAGLFAASFLLIHNLLFYPEAGSSTFLRNVGEHLAGLDVPEVSRGLHFIVNAVRTSRPHKNRVWGRSLTDPYT